MGGVCVFVFTSVSKLFCVSVACHYPSDKDTSLSHKILQNLIISTLQIHPAENLHLAFQDTEQFLECAILFSSILNTLLHHPHLPGKKKKSICNQKPSSSKNYSERLSCVKNPQSFPPLYQPFASYLYSAFITVTLFDSS